MLKTWNAFVVSILCRIELGPCAYQMTLVRGVGCVRVWPSEGAQLPKCSHWPTVIPEDSVATDFQVLFNWSPWMANQHPSMAASFVQFGSSVGCSQPCDLVWRSMVWVGKIARGPRPPMVTLGLAAGWCLWQLTWHQLRSADVGATFEPCDSPSSCSWLVLGWWVV